jgi:O-antigen/teichoic acid export membrane protein
MKPRSFFKNLSLLLVLNILVKPVWIFFIDRSVQNTVGFEAYGQYFAVLNLTYVLYFLADAGLSNWMNQRIASGNEVSLSQLIKLKLALLFLFTAAVAAVAFISGVDALHLVWPVIAIQVLNSVFVFLRSLVTARQFFKTDAFLSVLDKTLMIGLCAPFIFFPQRFGDITLPLFLQWQMLATGIAVVSAAVFLFWKKGEQPVAPVSTPLILQGIMPFALIILLMSTHYRLDGFLLEQLHSNGSFEAGVYAAAYRLLDAANMMGYLAAGFLVPFIARHQQEREVLNKTVLFTRHGLMLIGIGTACFVWVFALELHSLLYGDENISGAEVMRLCLATLPAYFLTHIYGSVLTATARFKAFIQVLLASVLINAGLNIVFIPIYGAEGAAWVSIISQYICAAGCIWQCRKTLRLYASHFFVYALLCGALLLLFYFGKIQGLNLWAMLAIALILAGIVVIAQRKLLKPFFTPPQ